MTLQERADAYAKAFAKWPASWPRVVREQDRDVLYGVFVIGNDYRGTSKFYGAFPPTFLARVMALFQDALGSETLHVFSGSLPEGDYIRCDSVQPAELQCSVYDLPEKVGAHLFRLVIADPPYSELDAEKYIPREDRHALDKETGINRLRATEAIAAVTHAGGHLAWLDTCWPQHRKEHWLTVGRILIQRSTNHRARVLTLFERTAN